MPPAASRTAAPVEIQRLIGRSLRSVVDFKALGERTVWIDCDVLQADGGTRCAAICGGYVALHLALSGLVDAGKLRELPLPDSVAAVSVGSSTASRCSIWPTPRTRAAEVDMNVVISGNGQMIEVQATAERTPFGTRLAGRAAGAWRLPASRRSRALQTRVLAEARAGVA